MEMRAWVILLHIGAEINLEGNKYLFFNITSFLAYALNSEVSINQPDKTLYSDKTIWKLRAIVSIWLERIEISSY